MSQNKRPKPELVRDLPIKPARDIGTDVDLAAFENKRPDLTLVAKLGFQPVVQVKLAAVEPERMHIAGLGADLQTGAGVGFKVVLERPPQIELALSDMQRHAGLYLALRRIQVDPRCPRV